MENQSNEEQVLRELREVYGENAEPEKIRKVVIPELEIESTESLCRDVKIETYLSLLRAHFVLREYGKAKKYAEIIEGINGIKDRFWGWSEYRELFEEFLISGVEWVKDQSNKIGSINTESEVVSSCSRIRLYDEGLAFFHLGRLYQDKGEREKALRCYNIARRNPPLDEYIRDCLENRFYRIIYEE